MAENSSVLYIAHFGTKGQKWGIRKYQRPDGSLTPAGRARYGKGDPRRSSVRSMRAAAANRKPQSTDEAQQDENPKPRKKSLSEMSDDELRSEINRLSLEKQYKQLINDVSPPKKHKARELISEMATASIKNIGTQTMTYAMGTAINKVCRGVFHINEDIVNAKKGQSDKK